MGFIYWEKDGLCFLAGTKCAIWRKPGSGSKFDPYRLPMSHLDKLLFHSDFGYFGVVAKNMSKVVNHQSVPGYGPVTLPETSISFHGQSIERTSVLLDHNLGYVPKFFVAQNGERLPPGAVVQWIDSGRWRVVAAYATTTQIVLWERGSSSSAELPAVDITYQAVAFRTSAEDPALPTFQIKPGVAIFGRGKFRMENEHLRRAGAGDGPFSYLSGPHAAVDNGTLALWRASGTYYFAGGGFGGTVPSPSTLSLAV